ncbi:MAG: choice-of-anchor Q domain-containing protein [Kiritimatiellae bacterium]|nr:choice-of-anchor Q domain-containing protein [Kiritimatiellia bacterium]
MSGKWLKASMMAAAIGLIGPIANGTDYYVSTNGNHTTFTSWATAATNIQAAVNAALGGDTVWVSNGVYTGSGGNVVELSNNVTLKSVNGASVTFIDGQAARRCVYIHGPARSVIGTLDGFTLTNGAAIGGGGVWLGSDDNVGTGTGMVQNCRIAGNTANGGGYGGGAFIRGPGGRIRNCIVWNNTSPGGYGGGVMLDRGSVAENCLIMNNTSAGGYTGGGVMLLDDTWGGSLLRNCTVVANTSPSGTGSGVGCRGPGWGGGRVQNCIVWGNTGGYNIYNWATNMIVEYSCVQSMGPSDTYGGGVSNIATAPLFANSGVISASYKDYHPLFGSLTIDAGKTVADGYHHGAFLPALTNDLDAIARPYGAMDMGCYEYANTPKTLYVSRNGNHVAPFTNWVNAATTIQAAVNAAYAWGGDTVLVTNGVYRGSGLEVVTITNAVTVKSVNGYAGTIIDGQGVRAGVSMQACGANGKGLGLLDGFTITNGYGGSPNYRNGAGLYIYFGTAQNCWIVGNVGDASGNSRGGGAFLYPGAVLRNSIISSNTCYLTPGVCAQWGGLIENCLIRDNGKVGDYYGAVNVVASTIRNSTIVGNKAYAGSGVAVTDNNGGSIQNCVIWGNTVSDDVVNNYSGTVFENCDVESVSGSGGYGGGAGNFSADPRVVKAAARNYTLQRGSPCIDAGKTIASITNDLNGAVRPTDGNGDGVKDYDIGCYEAPAARGTLILIR